MAGAAAMAEAKVGVARAGGMEAQAAKPVAMASMAEQVAAADGVGGRAGRLHGKRRRKHVVRHC